MIKYPLDTRQPRAVTVFYACRTVREIAYRNVPEKARRDLGINIVYALIVVNNIPPWWNGKRGYITPQMIKAEVPYYARSTFYISGPKGMVDSFREILDQLQIRPSHIKTDYFSGLA